jgi:hypothetical protein
MALAGDPLRRRGLSETKMQARLTLKSRWSGAHNQAQPEDPRRARSLNRNEHVVVDPARKAGLECEGSAIPSIHPEFQQFAAT